MYNRNISTVEVFRVQTRQDAQYSGKGGQSLADRLLDGFFNLFFAGFCLWGVYAAYAGWQLQTRGVRTTGMVVRLDERSNDGGCCTYVPVVDFSVNEQVYTFEGDNATYPPRYEIGEQVNVRYDPTNPNTAQIDSLFELWVFPVIIIPAMIVAALVLNVFAVRAWRRGEPIGE